MLPKELEDKAMTLSGSLDDEAKLKKFILGQCFEARTVEQGSALKNLETGDTEERKENEGNDEELNAWDSRGWDGKGTYFEGSCTFCGIYGHKKALCRKLDTIMNQSA